MGALRTAGVLLEGGPGSSPGTSLEKRPGSVTPPGCSRVGTDASRRLETKDVTAENCPQLGRDGIP